VRLTAEKYQERPRAWSHADAHQCCLVIAFGITIM
jgi:hypothetical protein